jgi:hypothetical protein
MGWGKFLLEKRFVGVISLKVDQSQTEQLAGLDNL